LSHWLSNDLLYRLTVYRYPSKHKDWPSGSQQIAFEATAEEVRRELRESARVPRGLVQFAAIQEIRVTPLPFFQKTTVRQRFLEAFDPFASGLGVVRLQPHLSGRLIADDHKRPLRHRGETFGHLTSGCGRMADVHRCW
jgi:hypothetical protein